MTHISNGPRFFLLLGATLLLSGSLVQVQAQKRKRHKVVDDPAPLADVVEPGKVRLKLADGTYMQVEDAWESEQGIWYKKSGVTHLVTRDRVKAIERGSDVKPKQEPQVALVKEVKEANEASPVQLNVLDRPAWIYLTGGARFEADSVNESAAGVWYKRGSLSVFIERIRIDHIEREDPESLAKSDSSKVKERGWSTGNQKIDSLIRQSGAKYGVDPYLIFCVMEQESHFNSRAVSPKGAQGLMQLMPGTGARFGVRRPHDPAQNIAGGTRYLKQLLNRFSGRVDLVLASYNAGEGAVIKFGHRVPPYKETRDYVKRISYRYRGTKTKAPVSAANHVSAGGL